MLTWRMMVQRWVRRMYIFFARPVDQVEAPAKGYEEGGSQEGSGIEVDK
jgi:hypothetical protein